MKGAGSSSMTPRRFSRAFSMAEATLSVFILGVVLVAALSTVGASGRARQKMADRARGTPLAQDLMTEILQNGYNDPESPAASLGTNPPEHTTGDRSLYDDVDDYDDWSASPPETKDGEPIDGFDDWRRSVEVAWIDPDDLTQVCGSETGVKRITVTVAHHDVPVATLVAIRTNAWRNLGDENGGGGDSGNSPPTAVAQGFPLSGEEDLTVNFSGGGSSDPDPGDTLTYEWDFGDGDTGSGVATLHTYDDAGSYSATLIVSDGRGGVDTDTLTINVWD